MEKLQIFSRNIFPKQKLTAVSQSISDDDELSRPSTPNYEYRRTFVAGPHRSVYTRLRSADGPFWVVTWVFIAFIVNICFLLVIRFGIREKGPDGLPSFNPRSCDASFRWSAGLSFAINILSSTLLGASNYYMQRLSACTRAEIDNAHREGSWVEVGTSSLRNLRFISWERILLWVLLAVSCLPVHFLYNSVVIEARGGNLFRTAAISSKLVDSGQQTIDYPEGRYEGDFYSGYFNEEIDLMSYENISAEACVKRYYVSKATFDGPTYIINGGSVVAVSSDPHLPRDVIFAGGNSIWSGGMLWQTNFTSSTKDFQYPNSTLLVAGLRRATLGQAWVCEDQAFKGLQDVPDVEEGPDFSCDIESLGTKEKPWTLGGHTIAYCLAEKRSPQCKIEFSSTLLMIVCVCNAIKLAVMVYIYCRDQHRAIITIGDAMASFLNDYRLTATSSTTPHAGSMVDSLPPKSCYTVNGPIRVYKPWQRKRTRWLRSVRWSDWLLLVALTGGALGASIALMRNGIVTNKTNSSIRSSTGLDKFGTDSTDKGEIAFTQYDTLMANAIISNTPQFIVSVIYFYLNAVLTTMVKNAEWTSYATYRKSLRTTIPRGQQRSTYWLQLPYRYSAPLSLAIVFLHWAISQSIYVSRFIYYVDGHPVPDPETGYEIATPWYHGGTLSLGWSSSGLLLCIVLGASILMACIALGIIKRYDAGLPVLDRTSLTILEACQHGPENQSIELSPLQWGVIEADQYGPSRCGFASKNVRMPYDGEVLWYYMSILPSFLWAR